MIYPCKCKNEYQDKAYGPGNRVFNPKVKKANSDLQQYTCTVCKAEVKK